MGGLEYDILTTVAAKEGVAVEELPPLQDHVAVDGLTALTRHAASTEGASVAVRFEYAGWSVFVAGSGDVRVEG